MADARAYLNRLLGRGQEDSHTTAIPEVPPSADRGMVSFLTAVKEWIGGASGSANPLAKLVSWSDLVSSGLARTDADGNVVAGDGTLDYTPPPPPTGLTATGAMTHILLEWDAPAYGNHAYTEIWAHSADALGSAVMVGTSPGVLFPHPVGTAQTRYYWIRFVSTAADVEGAYNASAGVVGTTSEDVAFLLDVLTGELTDSQLVTALKARIDLIDDADTVEGSVAKRIKTAQDTLQAQINTINSTPAYDNAVDYAVDDTVTYSGGMYKVSTETPGAGYLPTNTTYWTKIGDYASLADAVIDHAAKIDQINYVNASSTSASAVALSGLSAQVNHASTGLPAAHSAITTEASTRASADTAMASDISALEASVNDASTGLATKASVAYVDTAEADAVSAAATASQTLVSAIRVGGTNLVVDSESVAGYSIFQGDGATIELIADQVLPDGSTGSVVRITSAPSGQTIIRIPGCVRSNDSYSYSLYHRANGTSSLLTEFCDSGSYNSFNFTTAWAYEKEEGTVVITYEYGVRDHLDFLLGPGVVLDIWHLQVEVGNKATPWSPAPEDITAAIQTEATTRATQTGELYAQYTVKVDVNGYVAGYGLASTLIDDTPYSEFAIVADAFTIAPVNTDNTAADGSPFFYRTMDTVINGVTVPAGAYMKAAYIHDASITNAKIANLAVDDAKIVNLSAAKINAGFLSADRIEAGSITAAKITATTLSSIVANLGTITAGNITLDTSGFIRGGSTGYLTGTGFWMGYHSGAYKFHIGNPAGQYFAWTGTTLAVGGDIIATGNIKAGGITTTLALNSAGGTHDVDTEGATKTLFSGNIVLDSAGNLLININVAWSKGDDSSNVAATIALKVDGTTVSSQGVYNGAGNYIITKALTSLAAGSHSVTLTSTSTVGYAVGTSASMNGALLGVYR